MNSTMPKPAPEAGKPPFRPINFAEPKVLREERADGATVLRAAQPLAAHERSLARLFRRAVERQPDRLLMAERDASGAWAGVTYAQARRKADAIAQALITRPRVLLLDEPFGALDPGIRKDMHALLLELWRETGLTVFMVTHDLSEGFSLGTRLLVFDKVRLDPHAPNAFGARITYDIPLNSERRAALPAQLAERLQPQLQGA